MKVIVIYLGLMFSPFKSPEPKLLTVKADLPTWQVILNVIDMSKAEPEQRIAAREFILRQLNDTTINKR